MVLEGFPNNVVGKGLTLPCFTRFFCRRGKSKSARRRVCTVQYSNNSTVAPRTFIVHLANLIMVEIELLFVTFSHFLQGIPPETAVTDIYLLTRKQGETDTF